jgi:indolepyruvate decarboxylase
MKMSIGSFLIDRLVSLGVSRIYGVPGDYNLEFLELLENSKRLSFVGTCNELNAAYAADGEARLKGISVVLTTYGVGDLAALPGIAGSYSEGVPVLSISGAPPLRAIRSEALLHHTPADGNYGNVMQCFHEFTVAQALITPESAVYEIDRVLQACWREKRPAHLQLPSDICFIEIDVPDRAGPDRPGSYLRREQRIETRSCARNRDRSDGPDLHRSEVQADGHAKGHARLRQHGP